MLWSAAFPAGDPISYEAAVAADPVVVESTETANGSEADLASLSAEQADLMARDPDALAYAIRRSCENKAEVAAADERESGQRALLNLGHTFGHAIETGMGYGNWLHGEGVSAGTMLAADL